MRLRLASLRRLLGEAARSASPSRASQPSSEATGNFACDSGKNISWLILRRRVMAASPTGIFAFSSMTRYSRLPSFSTATTSKEIWRTGTGPKRFFHEVSYRMLLSITSCGTPSSLPASRRRRNSLMARKRWARPRSSPPQSSAVMIRGIQSVGWVLSPSKMPKECCSSRRHPCARRILSFHCLGPVRPSSSKTSR